MIGWLSSLYSLHISRVVLSSFHPLDRWLDHNLSTWMELGEEREERRRKECW